MEKKDYDDLDSLNTLDDDMSTVILEDEEGKEFEFQIIKTYEVGDEMYAALVPVNEEETEFDDDDLGESTELVVLKFFYEDGEEFLSVIDDDDEYERALDALMENLPEDYDIQ